MELFWTSNTPALLVTGMSSRASTQNPLLLCPLQLTKNEHWKRILISREGIKFSENQVKINK